MDLSAWQWTWLAAGAFLVGLSKTGMPGLGVLTVACFAYAMPARASTGALLPLLLCADVFSVAFFRKHADWSHLGKLLPWVFLGILAGFLAMGRINDQQVRKLMGLIILALLAVNLWMRLNPETLSSQLPHSIWFVGLIGMLAGFSTMVANAAGPVMVLYFLAVGLPKLAFIGTSAWFFMLVNTSKVPFSALLGLITPGSLQLDALLLLPMIPGALLGPILLRHINQKTFENIALVLALFATIKLLI